MLDHATHSPENRIHIYSPDQQGSGSFDDGKITEIKPIGFRGEGSAVTRIGPLFYWAWAVADGSTQIALHPHRGFEIASYVLQGEIGHYDTGGHQTRISTGGVQVMQTGSGISHEETTFGGHNEFFQIWFEPNLREAVTRPPVYHEFADDELPVHEMSGVRIKSIIGGASPLKLTVEARMEHWALAPDTSHPLTVEQGRAGALVVVSGSMTIEEKSRQHAVQPRDFVVISSGNDAVSLVAGREEVSVVGVWVPTEVSYSLLPK